MDEELQGRVDDAWELVVQAPVDVGLVGVADEPAEYTVVCLTED